jgi:hypothetical protein
MLLNIIFDIKLKILTVVKESRTRVNIPIKNIGLPTMLPKRSRQIPSVIIRLPDIKNRLTREKFHTQAKNGPNNPFNQKPVMATKEIAFKKTR